MATSSPHCDLPLRAVLERLRDAATRPFDQALPIPPEVHHSAAFLEHERDSVFTQSWLCVGRADEIAEHGDYLTHDIAGVPVIVIRHEDGSINAFVNACAHRFTRLLDAETGSRKKIICPYHAWTYDCAGALVRAPFMEMKDGFDSSRHNLRPLHVEVWEGFVFVTLADEPDTSLADALAPLRDNVVGRYGMA